MKTTTIESLPEGCISHIISFTSPRDACRSAATSAAFRSAAGSDTVWGSFLPPDHELIVAQAVEPLGDFASKKELYFRLCSPLLIDGGKMSFALDKESGKKCIMLSARELGIIWGDEKRHWRWINQHDARFSQVAELVSVWWLEINGKIDCRILSQKTSYVAYFSFRLSQEAEGLQAQEASVSIGDHVSKRNVSLQGSENEPRQPGNRRQGVMFGMRRPYPPGRQIAWILRGAPVAWSDESDEQPPPLPSLDRSDGWMEIELGEFFNDEGDDGEVRVSLSQVNTQYWKSGLFVQGIEVRPKAIA